MSDRKRKESRIKPKEREFNTWKRKAAKRLEKGGRKTEDKVMKTKIKEHFKESYVQCHRIFKKNRD